MGSVNLGWPSPVAPWPLWLFGSWCGLSICLLPSRPGGTGAAVDPPHPSQASPSPASRPDALVPESAHCCQLGPRTQSWTPPCTHTHEHTCTHTIPTHMLSIFPLYICLCLSLSLSLFSSLSLSLTHTFCILAPNPLTPSTCVIRCYPQWPVMV